VDSILPLSRRELQRPYSPTAGASGKSGSEKDRKSVKWLAKYAGGVRISIWEISK